MSNLSLGETVLCMWKDDKIAAYSIGGDDCLRSQLFFAMPEMERRGIYGTWWVNPGRAGPVNYKDHDDEWAECWIACYDQWKAADTRGHDFANHTMHHQGAATYEEAEQEIRQTAEIIWQTNPRQRLQLFLRGGNPTWEVNPDLARLKGYVDTAIAEGSWHLVGFHGIGPDCEWGGPVDGAVFTGMLDYLFEKRNLVWTGTHTEVHKYDQERSTASVSLLEVTPNGLRLNLSSEKEPRLYDYPLTLRTKVDPGWERVLVSQGGVTHSIPVNAGMV